MCSQYKIDKTGRPVSRNLLGWSRQTKPSIDHTIGKNIGKKNCEKTLYHIKYLLILEEYKYRIGN